MPSTPKANRGSSVNQSPTLASQGGKSHILQLRRRYRQVSGQATATTTNPLSQHIAFIPLLVLVLIIWCIYRYLFRFPVWFDETIGKAVFFGLPVWLYLSITRSRAISETIHLRFLQPGLWMGLAIGGIFGFAGVLASLWQRGVVVQAAPLFAAESFWWEFFLALMTGFWESLFFYCWIMTVILEKFRHWSLMNQVVLTALIFLVFHLPNTLLRFDLSLVGGQLILLFFFAVGQALLFARVRNLYALTIAHALWGMVLLIHTR